MILHDYEEGVGTLQHMSRYMRASYSSFFGSDQFVMEFSTKTLKQFYLNMPQSFMGLPGRGESRIESSQHAAIVRKAACSNSTQAGEFGSWGCEHCSYLSWQRNPAQQLII